jgi:hypothetical protein
VAFARGTDAARRNIIVTATLVLLFELQYPFQSALRIPPDDWVGVVSHIQFMQSGPQPGMRM